jgi:hypothetical protein
MVTHSSGFSHIDARLIFSCPLHDTSVALFCKKPHGIYPHGLLSIVLFLSVKHHQIYWKKSGEKTSMHFSLDLFLPRRVLLSHVCYTTLKSIL